MDSKLVRQIEQDILGVDTSHATWDSIRNYVPGDTCRWEFVGYIAQMPSQNIEPGSHDDNGYWAVDPSWP